MQISCDNDKNNTKKPNLRHKPPFSRNKIHFILDWRKWIPPTKYCITFVKHDWANHQIHKRSS